MPRSLAFAALSRRLITNRPLNLSREMSHPRDSLLSFNEKDHVYIFLPTGEEYISGTTFLHKFFPPFDGPKIVDKMMGSRNWDKSPYRHMTKDQILANWELNRDTAAKAGTLMHARIESELKGETIEWSGQERERDNFRAAWAELQKEGYRVYRLEWRIHTPGLAGTLDGLFINDRGEFLLLDWKRSKEIKTENRWQCLLSPLEHLPDCNYIHYSLQLNLYRWILRKHYEIDVREMRLYSFHPDQKTFLKFTIPVMEKEIQLLLKSL